MEPVRADSAATRQCRACGASKPDTPEFFYLRTGKLISRCRDCRMGGARPNSGGARPGAGRKPKRLQESGIIRLKLTREMLVECEDGHRACDACGRILRKSRFRFPTLYRKEGQIRRTWLPL